MGYTPLFDTLLTGTLFGKWPHTGIWACLLSRASREGVIDEQPAAIAAAIGVPLDILLQCIRDFMAPDPDSRTPDHDGRRLELIDPRRTWGWRVLNHAKYRDKARKKAFDEERVESGENRDRMKQRRTKAGAETPPAGSHDADPTRPDETQRDPPSEAEAEAEAKASQTSESERARGAPTTTAKRTGGRIPDDFALTPERRKVAEVERIDPDRTFAKFVDYWRSATGAKARKLDWDATWRNWCRTEADRGAPPKRAGQGSLTEADRQTAIAEAWDRQKARARSMGFRMPLAGEALDNYRLKIDEAVSEAQERGRSGGAVPIGQLLKKAGGQ